MQNANDGCSSGSKNESDIASPGSCVRCPHRETATALRELTEQMARQNQLLWSLVEQTAALIEIVAETSESEEDSQQRYLDGTPISG